MRAFIAFSALALLAACATPGEQVASADCKIYPLTSRAAGVNRPAVSPLEQRHAEMQLATSEFRMRNLRQNGPSMNLIEDALRDCNTR